MKKGLRILGGLAVIAAGVSALRWGAARWRTRTVTRLNSESHIAQTTLGPVEYAQAGSGKPVMIVHGTPGGYDQALVVGEAVLSPANQVIAPSRPGYLRTPLSSGRTPEEQADLMVALMDTLLIDRAAVIGVSGGGPVAVQMVIRYPQRVSCLILLAALVQPKDLDTANLTDGLMTDDLAAWIMLSLVHLAPERLLPEDLRGNPLAVQTVDRMAGTTFPLDIRRDGIHNDADQYRQFFDLPLHEIHIPVLIVHGEQDTNIALSQAEYAAAMIPQAQLETIPNGTHLTVLVAPQTSTAIQTFLAECNMQ